MNKYFFILFVSFSALFFTAAIAQEADTTEIKFFPPEILEVPSASVSIMEPLFVTSTRSLLPLRATPVITRVIYPADIVRSGVSSVSALLERELAGVEFHQAGYGASMSFQGLDARYALILVDGERMAGETYGNVDFSRIQMNNIARIEIVRGASSVLYGSNAMGAVVNIITKMPQKKIEVSGSLRFGTRFQNNSGEMLQNGASDKDLDYYRGRLDLPNTKSDVSVGLNLGKFRSLTGFACHTTDAYKVIWRENEIRTYETLTIASTAGGPPRVSNGEVVSVVPDTRGLGVSGARDYSLSQRFDYRISRKFNFSAAGNYFNKDQYGFRTSIMDDNPMSATSTTPWKYETFEGYNVKAMMEHDPNSYHKVTLSYVRDEYIRDEQTRGGALKHKQRHSYNNPRLLWNYRISYDNRLTTGVEMLNENLQFDINPLGFDSKKSLNSGSVYVQDELFMHSKLSFVAGARGDYSDRFGWGFTPKVSAKYNVDDFILRANYSRGYRTPSLKELYMELSVPSAAMVIKGNENLKSETNNYYSLSGEYNYRTFSVSVTGFVSDFKNKIDVYSTKINNVNTMLYDNIVKSKLAGVELIASYLINNKLRIKANYNYVKTVSDDAPKGSTQYIFPSEHTATGTVAYDLNIRNDKFVVISANVRYVGAKDYQDLMTYVKPSTIPGKFDIYSGNYSAHHKGYMTCGAAASARWSEKIITTIGVDNIFNYRPPVVNFNSAMMASRNGFIQINFNF